MTEEQARQPIIILGANHAGTRLVVEMLQALGSDPGDVSNMWKENTLFLSFHHELIRRVTDIPWSKAIFDLGFVENFSDDETHLSWVESEVAQKLTAAYPDHKSAAWHWKCPTAALFLPTWLSLYPDAIFVHVTRDPLGVAESLLRRRQYHNPFKALRFNRVMNEKILATRPQMKHYVHVRFDAIEDDLEKLIAALPHQTTGEQRQAALQCIRRRKKVFWKKQYSWRRNVWEIIIRLMLGVLRPFVRRQPSVDPAHVQDFYNTHVSEAQPAYEHNRWFKDPIAKIGYEMTLDAIKRHCYAKLPHQINTYLEVGPGPGTWTAQYARRWSETQIDLVDISSSMLDRSQERFADKSGMRFFETDFGSYRADRQYDCFFSSRAFEYMPNKKAIVAHIYELLRDGGNGFLITKTPKYLRSRLLRREVPAMHRGQIAPRALKQLLTEAGFTNIRIVPVTVSIPLVHSPRLNWLAYQLFRRLPFNPVTQFFSESYAVSFQKL